jgi:hypothetical protein
VAGVSDVVLVGLITGGVGVAGLVVNVWNQAQERRSRLEMERIRQEEHYRSSLYERRLEVHQKGYSLVQRLCAVVQHATDPSAEAVIDSMREFMDWFNSHMLYLDPVSIHEFARLLPLWSEWRKSAESTQFLAQVDVANEAIIKGTGLKHIDWDIIKDDIARISEEPE